MTPSEKDAVLYAKTGKLEKLTACLDAGVSPNTTDESRASLLMHAASRGHFPVVAELLRRGADANFVGFDDSTALFQARQAGHAKIVELLKSHAGNRKGYDIDEPLRCPNLWQGYCALHDAIWDDFQHGRELNEHEYAFQSLHPFLTLATGWGFDEMLSNRGYWCIPAGIRLFDALGEPHYAAILRRADEIVRRHAERIGYSLEHEKPEGWKWDRSVLEGLEKLQEESQFWNMNQEEYDRLTRKTFDYVRENRQHFSDATVA
jgi:hypothetical protein